MFEENPTKFIEEGVSSGLPIASHISHDKIFKFVPKSMKAFATMTALCVTSLIATQNGSTVNSSSSRLIEKFVKTFAFCLCACMALALKLPF